MMPVTACTTKEACAQYFLHALAARACILRHCSLAQRPQLSHWFHAPDARKELRLQPHAAARGRFATLRAIANTAEQTPSEDAQQRQFVHALVLAWFALPNRSLLPARCLVETATEMYRCGLWLQDLQLSLSVATLESGGQLLAPIEQDLLLLWTGMVFLTLRELDIPLHPMGRSRGDSVPRLEETSPRLKGMQGFVRRMISQHREGMDSRRLLLQQALAQSEVDAGNRAKPLSPTVSIMQQNSRLIVLTLEMTADMLPQPPSPSAISGSQAEPAPSSPSSSPDSGSSTSQLSSQDDIDLVQSFEKLGYIQGFLPEPQLQSQHKHADSADLTGQVDDPAESRERWPEVSSLSSIDIGFPSSADTGQSETPPQQEQQHSRPERLKQARSLAMRLLIAFTGAAQDSLYSVTSFVDDCLSCYRQGWAVSELHSQVTAQDLEQCGGLFKVSAISSPQDESSALASPAARIFAQWLSIVYMTAAQMGVPREGSTGAWGWAWAEPDKAAAALDATRLSDFVANTLQSEEQAEDASEALQALKDHLAAAHSDPQEGASAQASKRMQQQEAGGASIAVMEDSTLQHTSSTLSLFSQQIQLVKMVRKRIADNRDMEHAVVGHQQA